jgi:hypothetical protein
MGIGILFVDIGNFIFILNYIIQSLISNELLPLLELLLLLLSKESGLRILTLCIIGEFPTLSVISTSLFTSLI